MAAVDPGPECGIQDMTTLNVLSEESIMENLRQRYDSKLIYTYTGSILVAMNPFATVNIYSNIILKKYNGKKLGENPPHIFAVAEAAYGNVQKSKSNQSVIISGESGAGKSESTKLILQYLTAITQNHAGSAGSWVEQQILEANTILEAFGNAKTVRNNNSSRFGKFIQVLFNNDLRIIGASIVNYLLEKSRVVKQAKIERNYHVFYQLVQGANDDEKQRYKLGAASDYHYLTQSGCIDIPGVNDRKHFEGLKLAFTVLKMDEDGMRGTFTALSGILTLGNVTFKPDSSGESVTIANPDVVSKVAGLWGVDEKKLSDALIYKKLTIRNETTMKPLTPTQALDNRDSIAKAVYDNLFQRIVEFINASLVAKEKSSSFIGVLDIFGFENFEINSFEQLCINYTNEKLQQFFNQFIFKLEQEEYDKEQIKWDKINFTDNAVCLELLEGKPVGIYAMLDEETKVPKGTDDTYLQKMETTHAKHSNFIKPTKVRGQFGIRHYAGDVLYTVAGFLEKNKDAIADELYDLIYGSKIPFVGKIFPPKEPETAKGSAPGKSSGAKLTAGGYFKNQLVSLVSTLGATAPHYVRCIKPNMSKEAFSFEDSMVLSQLRYSGMLDTIRIRKAGFPVRLAFDAFVKTFNCLIPAGMTLKSDPRQVASKIMQESKIKQESWQTGKTKLFLRSEGMAAVQERADIIWTVKVIVIQKFIKGFQARQRYLRKRQAVMLLQKYAKGFVYRRLFKRKMAAIVTMQAVVRGWFARDYYRTLKAEHAAEVRRQEEEKRREREKREKAEAAAAAAAAAAKGVAQAPPPPKPTPISNAGDEEELKALLVVAQKKAGEENNKRRASVIGAPPRRPSSIGLFPPPVPVAAAPKLAKMVEQPDDGGGVDDLFSFLGDFNNDKKKAAPLKGAALLANMADMLTSEIDSMFDDGPPKPSSQNMSPGYALLNLMKPVAAAAAEPKVKKLTNNPLARAAANKPMNGSDENLPEKFNYNAREWLLKTYAEHHFESHAPSAKSGTILTLRKQPKAMAPTDIDEMLVYTKQPITFSMTCLPRNERVLDAAIECFKWLLKALDPTQKKTEEGFVCIQNIITTGLEMPELRDEIFVQICRQVTAPRTGNIPGWDAIVMIGWQIMALTTSCFPPSKLFSKFLQAFIQRTLEGLKSNAFSSILKLAHSCEANLRNVMLNGPRKQPPSIAEILAIKNGTPIRCEIHFMDANTQVVEITSNMLATEVVKELGYRVDLKDTFGWSLYHQDDLQVWHVIKSSDYIADIVSGWESRRKPAIVNLGSPASSTPSVATESGGTIKKGFLRSRSPSKSARDSVISSSMHSLSRDGSFASNGSQNTSQVSLHITGSAIELGTASAESQKIYLRRRLFKNPQDPVLDPVEYTLLWAQATTDTATDFHHVNDKVAAQLAALNAQVAFPDLKREEASLRIGNNIEKWLSLRVLSARSREQWNSAVLEQYVKLKGTSPIQAKVMFMESARSFRFYGATLFPARYKGFWSYAENVLLAVACTGIEVVHTKTRETIIGYPFSEVLSFEYDNDVVSFTVLHASDNDEEEGRGEKTAQTTYQFIASQAEEVAALLREYYPTQGGARKPKDTSMHLDAVALTKDLEKRRNILLQKQLLRIPGPDGGTRTTKATGTIRAAKPTSSRPVNSFMRSDKDKDPAEIVPVPGTQPGLAKINSKMAISLEAYTEADWCFSKTPLVQSLSTLMAPIEWDEWSVAAHKVILGYAGITPLDRTPGDPAQCPHATTLQTLIQKVIETPELADELYLQLCKMTSSHPDPDSIQGLAMWKLMAICVGIVIPKGDVLEYLKAHLRCASNVEKGKIRARVEEAKYARYCMKILQKTATAPIRKLSPSVDEMMSATGAKSVQLKIHFLDGQFRVIMADPSSTFDDICKSVLDKLKMKNANGFCIFETHNNTERDLGKSDYLGETLSQWEKITKSTPGSEKVKFIFKRRIFYAPQERGRSDLEEELLRAQAMQEVVKGHFPLTTDDAALLGGLLSQLTFGDWTPAGYSPSSPNQLVEASNAAKYQSITEQYFPKSIASVHSLESDIESIHKGQKGRSHTETQMQLMKVFRSWKLYGSSVFDVWQSYTNEIPNDCWLAVNADGVHILARNSKDSLVTHAFKNIVSYSPSQKSILLITGSVTSGTKYVFTTSQASSIAGLIKDYSEASSKYGASAMTIKRK
ncbi:hypothetical protein SmJEL517_g01598 [Synchytrium microbalum]|uniref:Uncharacterized protein n=1 Tax=Synchytrium microbalum TaxID=1806994 RepID=A0A507CF19_9FUNG|nr:uncharacterized protein SmJEL517_g01598 [Synchytrium microbalum]TPX36113.1 hypothetical protein SmJEL517_g01598 [Synchytrium microbalum]